MEIQNQDQEKNWKDIEKAQRRGKITGGVLIVAIGSVFLAKELGIQIPFWVLSWKMLLIALGIITAVKHKFMHPGWIILIGVGSIFLISDIYPDLHIRPFLWPVIIIMVGLVIIFKPRRKHRPFGRHQWREEHLKRWHGHDKHNYKNRHSRPPFCEVEEPSPTDEDYIESTAVLAGVKKNIISKTFKGGEIVNVFGGTELNLMQADLEDKATLEITQVFGGTKLIVPSHWEVKSEMSVTVLGSVEDKRVMSPALSTEPRKVLVLVGTTVFGGIEIRS